MSTPGLLYNAIYFDEASLKVAIGEYMIVFFMVHAYFDVTVPGKFLHLFMFREEKIKATL